MVFFQLFLNLSLILGSPHAGSCEVTFAKGQIEFKNGNFKRALNYFNKNKQQKCKIVELSYWMGMTLLKTGDLKGAEKAFDNAKSKILNKNIHKILGIIRLKLKKLSWAMRSFQAALEEKPNDKEISLFLGYILVKMEEFDDAEEILKPLITISDKKISKKAKILLSLSYYKRKKLRKARLLLFSGDGSLSTNSSILKLLTIKELGLKKGFGVTLSLLTGYDSNPSMNSEGSLLSSTSQQPGISNTLAVSAWYNPTYYLSGEASIIRSFYNNFFDKKVDDVVSSFSMTMINSGAVYKKRFLSNGLHRKFEMGYAFSLLEFDGGDGIPAEPNPFLFLEKHGLLFGYEITNNPDSSFNAVFSPSYITYRDLQRTGTDLKLSGKWNLFFKNRTFKVFPQLYSGIYNAHGDFWDNFYAGLWLGISTIGPIKSDITAMALIEPSLFFNTKQSDSFDPKSWGLNGADSRYDIKTKLGISISKSFKAKTFKTGLNLSMFKNFSNAQYFNYNQFTITLFISMNMDLLEK